MQNWCRPHNINHAVITLKATKNDACIIQYLKFKKNELKMNKGPKCKNKTVTYLKDWFLEGHQ